MEIETFGRMLKPSERKLLSTNSLALLDCLLEIGDTNKFVEMLYNGILDKKTLTHDSSPFPNAKMKFIELGLIQENELTSSDLDQPLEQEG